MKGPNFSLKEIDAYRAHGFSTCPAHTITSEGFCTCRQTDCNSPGKHPRVNWSAYQHRHPTSEEWLIWSRRWSNPSPNVAIVTGKISGIVVIDIDPRHGGDESWADLCKELKLDIDTPTVLTGGGGRHLYFRHPGVEIRNATNVRPGIDVRGDGGYVIAPPSTHRSGDIYAWEVDQDLSAHIIGALPPKLLALLRQQGSGFFTGPARADLVSIIEGRVSVPEGDRNETMARLAGRFAGDPEIPEGEIYERLQVVNERSFQPPLEAAELRTITNSIIRAELRKKAATEALEAKIEDVSGLSPDDRMELAAQAWKRVGIVAVTDWFLMRGTTNDYTLVTPENEVHLGPRILDYTMIRHRIADELGVIAPSRKKVEWDDLAGVLRRLAREEEVEPARGSERLALYIEEYTARWNPQEVVPEERLTALKQGPILIDQRLHLRPMLLQKFIETTVGDALTTGQVRRLLKLSGWDQTRVWTGASTTSAWVSPNGTLGSAGSSDDREQHDGA